MQQGVQTDATCNIPQCCVSLHGVLFAFSLEMLYFLATYTSGTCLSQLNTTFKFEGMFSTFQKLEKLNERALRFVYQDKISTYETLVVKIDIAHKQIKDLQKC